MFKIQYLLQYSCRIKIFQFLTPLFVCIIVSFGLCRFLYKQCRKPFKFDISPTSLAMFVPMKYHSLSQLGVQNKSFGDGNYAIVSSLLIVVEFPIAQSMLVYVRKRTLYNSQTTTSIFSCFSSISKCICIWIFFNVVMF